MGESVACMGILKSEKSCMNKSGANFVLAHGDQQCIWPRGPDGYFYWPMGT
jgi:hypothetical protein